MVVHGGLIFLFSTLLKVMISIDVREGTSADVSVFGLRVHLVTRAIESYQKFGVRWNEIEVFLQIYY